MTANARSVVTTRQLNYPGDCRDIVGQIVGPTMVGQWLTIIAADYDPARDITEATLRASTQDEVDDQLPVRRLLAGVRP